MSRYLTLQDFPHYYCHNAYSNLIQNPYSLKKKTKNTEAFLNKDSDNFPTMDQV